jgi:hypothetical protein
LDGTSGTSGTSGSSGTGFTAVTNPSLTRVLTSDGTAHGAIANSGLTYDSQSQTLTVYGNTYVDSATQNNVGAGPPTPVLTLPSTTGQSAYFEYVVFNSGTTAMRAGTILSVWNSSGATYTDTSTTDLGESTIGISFQVTSISGTVTLNAIVTTGVWNIKVGTRVIF